MTHTTKHTPGPWKAVQHPREHKWAWTIEGADGVVQSIARMGLVDDAQAVAANAHLIAAAPAMYEALVETMRVLRSLRDNKEEWYTLVTPELLTAWDKNKAVLAQADGKP